MAIYKAVIQFEIVVSAKSKADAEQTVNRSAREEIRNLSLSDMCKDGVEVVRCLEELPKYWWDAQPWGSDNNKRLNEILPICSS